MCAYDLLHIFLLMAQLYMWLEAMLIVYCVIFISVSVKKYYSRDVCEFIALIKKLNYEI